MGMYSVQILIPFLRKIIVMVGAFDTGFDSGFLIG